MRCHLISLVLWGLSCIGSAGMSVEDSKAWLESRGIAPTHEGIHHYFTQALTSQTELDTRVAQLGHEDFNTRNRAVTWLSRGPLMPERALRVAIQDDDPELALNARKVLDAFNADGLQILLAALVLIPELDIEGLNGELISALAALDPTIHYEIWQAAFMATLPENSRPTLLNALRHETALIRWTALTALYDTAGSASAPDVRPLIHDTNESVQLLAAESLLEWGDRSGLPVLVDLLTSEHAQTRQECRDLLTSVTGNNFRFPANGAQAERERATAQWRAWLDRDEKIAPLTPRHTLEIDLIRGNTLENWVVHDDGKTVAPDGLWTLKDGVIACSEKANGYLRTQRSFKNYELTLEWRWPAPPKDGGVFLMMSQLDAMRPECLEVQLYNQRAGDFWRLGKFTYTTRGRNNMSFSRKFQDSSENVIGEWNEMRVRVHNGTVRVDVNGVRQNEATDTPLQAAPIGLQAERSRLEFRNIRIKPTRRPFLDPDKH